MAPFLSWSGISILALQGIQGSRGAVKGQGRDSRGQRCALAFDSDGGAGLQVIPVDIAERHRKLSRRRERGAGYRPDLLPARPDRASTDRSCFPLKGQAGELPVDMAAGADSFHDLLTQVAAFVKADGPLQSGLQQEVVLAHIDTVTKDAGFDAKNFPGLCADPG